RRRQLGARHDGESRSRPLILDNRVSVLAGEHPFELSSESAVRQKRLPRTLYYVARAEIVQQMEIRGLDCQIHDTVLESLPGGISDRQVLPILRHPACDERVVIQVSINAMAHATLERQAAVKPVSEVNSVHSSVLFEVGNQVAVPSAIRRDA